jgi:methionine S-methyltransferase
MSGMPTEIQFLERCQKSSQEAYDAFKALLVLLETPGQSKEALGFFHDLAARLIREHPAEQLIRQYHFSLSELALNLEDGGETRLLLLQLPSTFAPEEWSYTFFEGLTRYKPAEFQDRAMAELGCGIGWISLALAKQTKPAKIYGLDINPRAIVCSRINLFLNAYDRNGAPAWQHEGRTLDQIVEFHQSDLLDYCRKNRLILDRVIGCIPQVLNPDPEFTARMLTGGIHEQASDEFLHSLSNYAPHQGHIEDQFGLGLIARALEESVDVLRSSGKVILNLGGRPGTQVLQQLFLRRGFNVKPVWRTRVTQAKDTDIRGLVAIEEKTSHRFEFYMEHGSDASISARTALAYAEAGGEIAHGLSVFEARLRDPLHIPRILKLLTKPGYEDARRAIDLSYSEDSLAEEKMSFLSTLAETLEGPAFFPYEKTAGLQGFRRRLGYFFRNYYRIHYEERNFVITPSSAAICKNILALFRPKNALIDSQLAAAVGSGPGILEIPRSPDLLCEMIERLKPELAIFAMPEVEARSRDSFLRILEVSARAKTRVFIDVSELIELSSTPASNGIFRHLAQNPLPPHVSLICGLVKNRLYQDLQVCFVISENQELLENLTHAAELTYSRTPVLSQLYYDRILQDLLNFQITDGTRGRAGTERALVSEDGFFRKNFIGVSADAAAAFALPAIVGEKKAQQPGAKLRLDYGENCLPAPEALKRVLFEAFVKMQITADESNPESEVLELVRARFGLGSVTGLGHALANGVAPLFAEIADHCARTGRTLIFPSGAYGYFLASARFYGARTLVASTRAEERFKLTAPALEKALTQAGSGSWVVLSAPLVNPTGALYTSSEITALSEVARKHDALLILDSIFSGLEFESPQAMQLGSARWAVLGGLSKEFSAGGLRVGTQVCPQKTVLTAPQA